MNTTANSQKHTLQSVSRRAEVRSVPDRAAISQALPVNSRWFTRFFAGYSEWLVKRNFHSVRLLGAPGLKRYRGLPLVIYANHPSWWDPLVALVVWRRLLSERTPYAPIDAAMLEKYAFFKRLGFFGVNKSSLSGARQFLRISGELLTRPDTLLLITPQGRFADARDASAGFEPGLAHLANRVPNAVFLPLAMEIAYWEEKRPEVLLRFGEPVFPASDLRSDNERNADFQIGTDSGCPTPDTRTIAFAADRSTAPVPTDASFPLTPTLSPGERETIHGSRRRIRSPKQIGAWGNALPRPEGEGRGEGKQRARNVHTLSTNPNTRLEDALRAASARLAQASIHREVEAFQNLLAGRAGTQPVYDVWRRFKAALRGRAFTAAHGTK